MSQNSPFELREVAVILGAVTLGDDIRQARERLQMTQPELAERVGVSESTVSNWERGKSKPKNRLALVRQILRMDDTHGDAAHPPEDPLGHVSTRDLWQTLERRIFGEAGNGGRRERTMDSGGHGDFPDHLFPQSGKRRNQDGLQ